MARISSAVCLLLLVALSAVYEVQGTFLLKHYMRKFPRRSREFRPFACKGLLRFVDVLEVKCPLKPEYKNLFGNLRSYMGLLSSPSGSKNFDADLKGKAESVQSAMSALGGKGGSSADTSSVMNVLMSMGKTLSAEKSSESTEMTMGQRKELVMSMVKFARVISQFVVSAASKSGSSIDISSLGIDGLDANVATEGAASPSSGGSTGSASGSLSYMSGSPSSGMAGGPASSAEGGSSFGRSFSGKAGSTNYEGSVNYQAGGKSSQQTTTTGSS